MAGAVRSYREVLDSPQVQAKDSFVPETDEHGVTTLFARPPYHLLPDLHPETEPPPRPGDATVDLLHEIGVSADEIGRFREAGVISSAKELGV
jgi:crotonobetainyl-CoA:carnitine CoA-transferase CaiB-like acyl-CoA transferase